MKVVINSCFGGFGLSKKAENRIKELGGKCPSWSDPDEIRADPILVKVVEELGENANGAHAELKVVEIPDGIEWEIQEYDGSEHVAEKHRIWY